MAGFVKSWDHWLFLTLKEGNAEIIQLYDQIYSGILSSNKRSDVPFIPHIGLGLFTKQDNQYSFLDPTEIEIDNKRYDKAHREAKSLGLEYNSHFNKVSLITLNHNLTKIVLRKDIVLNNVFA